MASKLSVVFLLLFVCQVCFTARIPRDATTESPKNQESEEFKKMKSELEKLLTGNEKQELNEIINNITTVETLDQGITAALKLIELGVKASLREAETPSSNPASA